MNFLIKRYTLDTKLCFQSITLPNVHQFLSLKKENQSIFLWFKVFENCELSSVEFAVFTTGSAVPPNLKFIGTAFGPSLGDEYHVFRC